jgi:hypothetical protein
MLVPIAIPIVDACTGFNAIKAQNMVANTRIFSPSLRRPVPLRRRELVKAVAKTHDCLLKLCDSGSNVALISKDSPPMTHTIEKRQFAARPLLK